MSDNNNTKGEKFNLIDELEDGEFVSTEFILPEKIYNKAFQYAQGSKQLGHLTFEQIVQHVNYLETWEAPEEIIKEFPYYLAGYDSQNKPIWMSEAGRFNARKWVIRGGKDLKNLEKYMFQAAIRVLKSIAEMDQPGNEVTEGIFIADAEGFAMSQVLHLPTVNFAIQEGLKWKDIAAKVLGRLIIVNANYPTYVAAKIARPIAGKLMERVDIFGKNRAKWVVELRRLLPEETIPKGYGGSLAFKPVVAYGG